MLVSAMEKNNKGRGGREAQRTDLKNSYDKKENE